MHKRITTTYLRVTSCLCVFVAKKPQPSNLKRSLYLLYYPCLFLFLTFASCKSQSGIFTETNYVAVQPGDSEADIVRKAAQVVPSDRQL